MSYNQSFGRSYGNSYGNSYRNSGGGYKRKSDNFGGNLRAQTWNLEELPKFEKDFYFVRIS